MDLDRKCPEWEPDVQTKRQTENIYKEEVIRVIKCETNHKKQTKVRKKKR